MGLSFTIDSPVKVARYGISSVVSIMDDVLLEKLRKYYCELEGEPYVEIAEDSEDSRARRITEYLNLMKRIVSRQVKALQEAPFRAGSEITKYFEMLPEDSWLKRKYTEMLEARDESERKRREDELRGLAVPGDIDVNIMTKVDKDNYRGGKKLPPEHADAMSALRGFAESELGSSVVFSAGLNPRLYAYAAKFRDFLPDALGELKKRIILKVSDYRSAVIQGKFLAKHGLWVSEYRIESGLNCGGHAFATTGQLMGPILDEFRKGRDELAASIFKMYKRGLKSLGMECPEEPHDIKVTVQGGICSHEEDSFLMNRYGVDGTGWATPFMLVPEATTIDDAHVEKLKKAANGDVGLSTSSPFGIPFWTLRNSGSEERKKKNIEAGEPGMPCTKGLLKLNPEFSEKPQCAASRGFIKKKLDAIAKGGYDEEQARLLKDEALDKACICVDLAGSAELKYGIEKEAAPSLCPGPGISFFDRTYSLEEMLSHIYGRIDLLKGVERPHMFMKELALYIDYLKGELERYRLKLSARTPKYFREFHEGLLEGMEHYRALAEEFIEEKKSRFLSELDRLKEELDSIQMLEEVLGAESAA
jgi:hypothetical protein